MLLVLLALLDALFGALGMLDGCHLSEDRGPFRLDLRDTGVDGFGLGAESGVKLLDLGFKLLDVGNDLLMAR